MPVGARRREILQQLQAHGYAEAKNLASHLGVDSSTIRRDLDALAKAGQIHRTHGGARPVLDSSGDIPYAIKQTEHRAEKTAIAAPPPAEYATATGPSSAPTPSTRTRASPTPTPSKSPSNEP